jgi:glutamate synthase domain-containing protein 3
MTAGTVVVLGEVGLNFGAGMTGGDAFILDPRGLLAERLNPDLVVAQEPTAARLDEIRVLIERHARYTRSRRALELLAEWDSEATSIVHVAPRVEVSELETDDELVTEGAA